ncbi:hypothetical protein [uncultured Pseudodesulfovibrio sp.]|uniref:hypothetical protein n=1 Tax=uncultured Pseudodesulfovibrio sp. TaxID=2035858 RepID=UPI0029C8DA4B|nr:hypothetical protein [uncultured Pseudodesulfovibrio sp.]
MLKTMHLFLAATLLTALLVMPSVSTAGSLSLLSADEAQELALDDAEWEKGVASKGIGFGVGPKIVFESPEVENTDNGMVIKSPSQLSLLVVFKDGVAQVDMNTLNIRARKGWFSKNLTQRLAPYLEGNSIKAENVEIPSGRFKLEIKIADSKGNESIQEYLCEIQ